MTDEHVIRSAAEYQPAASSAEDCACPNPVPVQRAERKGVARTVCDRCGRPVPLRFTPRPRAWL